MANDDDPKILSRLRKIKAGAIENGIRPFFFVVFWLYLCYYSSWAGWTRRSIKVRSARVMLRSKSWSGHYWLVIFSGKRKVRIRLETKT